MKTIAPQSEHIPVYTYRCLSVHVCAPTAVNECANVVYNEHFMKITFVQNIIFLNKN